MFNLIEEREVMTLVLSVVCLGVIVLMRRQLHQVPDRQVLFAAAGTWLLSSVVTVVEHFLPPLALYDIVEHGGRLATTVLLAMWVMRQWRALDRAQRALSGERP